jgi:hypothetical protein
MKRIVLLTLTACACGSSLKVTPLKTSVQKPSNVSLYVTVETGGGDPVGGLAAEDFRIYEDGKLVSKFESQQRILNPEVAVVHYTMLLVDLSASVTASGSLEAVTSAADGFARRVAKIHQVGVYAFDGEREVHKIVPFSQSEGAVRGGLAGLRSYRAKDPSTNLNGAILDALRELTQVRRRSPVPLHFGSLVVFTDGTDRAGYAQSDEVRRALDESDVEVFVIGLGGEVDRGELEALGKDGFVFAENDGAVHQAFDQVAQRIENMARRYYLLSYCSPARAGTHTLRLEAIKGGARGATEYEFSATGFSPACDPNAKPAFQVSGLQAARARTPQAGERVAQRAGRTPPR